MFTALAFPTAKRWKQSTHPSAETRIRNVGVSIKGALSSLGEEGTRTQTMAWLYLEDITLRETSQTQKDKTVPVFTCQRDRGAHAWRQKMGSGNRAELQWGILMTGEGMDDDACTEMSACMATVYPKWDKMIGSMRNLFCHNF